MTTEKASELQRICINLYINLNQELEAYDLWNVYLKQDEG